MPLISLRDIVNMGPVNMHMGCFLGYFKQGHHQLGNAHVSVEIVSVELPVFYFGFINMGDINGVMKEFEYASRLYWL